MVAGFGYFILFYLFSIFFLYVKHFVLHFDVWKPLYVKIVFIIIIIIIVDLAGQCCKLQSVFFLLASYLLHDLMHKS